MFPSFEVFGKTIYMYPLAAAAGALAAGFLAVRLAKSRGIRDTNVIELLLFSAIGAAVGGPVLYALTQLRGVIAVLRFGFSGLSGFFEIMSLVFGGSVFYGGLIGGIIAGAICLRVKGWNAAKYLDVCAPAIPLFHAFGRIGCFLGGCCYGTESRFGFVYTHSLAEAANGVRRLPVPLFESVFLFALCAVLTRLYLRKSLNGRLFPLYLACYAIWRFGVEFFRGDAIRGFAFGLSVSQWISLGILAIVAVWTAVKIKNKEEAQ
ncbi:MAG: prolipoprotein diacylglyceryl transferase [Oscillospiraceae bacterium]|jgi:phosphatidylglycerol:prolipoprotein diacylglycerol transferase|nr:prolipoprotein diacylglyceryl transferase [Oscillospiraceae bacterium]